MAKSKIDLFVSSAEKLKNVFKINGQETDGSNDIIIDRLGLVTLTDISPEALRQSNTSMVSSYLAFRTPAINIDPAIFTDPAEIAACTVVLGTNSFILSLLSEETGTSYVYSGNPADTSWTLKRTFTGDTGNAATASKLETPRRINGTYFDGTADIASGTWGPGVKFSVSGDLTGTTLEQDGSTNVNIVTALASTGVVAGTYAKVTVDLKGRVTAGGVLLASDIPSLSADKITSGVLDAVRIPNLSASKITSGTLAIAQIPDLSAAKITSGELSPLRIPSLDASKVTTGIFVEARIPSLSASKITSGTLLESVIPLLDASKIDKGILGTARIPSLDAAKITTGVLHTDQIPKISANKIEGGVLPVNTIPSIDASKITSGVLDHSIIPSINASKITSGVLDTLRIPSLDAAKLTSGVLDALRIPSLDASKITTGVLNTARIPVLDGSKITTGYIGIDRINAVDASKITVGVLDTLRIPDLPASKITSGVFDTLRIPALDASKISTGTFNVLRIPDLDASKITTGTLSSTLITSVNASAINAGVLSVDRIPSLDTSKITTGVLDALRIPALDAGKITSGILSTARIPNLDAAKITSGVLDNDRLSSRVLSGDVSSYFRGPGPLSRIKLVIPFLNDENYMMSFKVTVLHDNVLHNYSISGFPNSFLANWWEVKVICDSVDTPDVQFGKTAEGFPYVSFGYGVSVESALGIRLHDILFAGTNWTDLQMRLGVWTITEDDTLPSLTDPQAVSISVLLSTINSGNLAKRSIYISTAEPDNAVGVEGDLWGVIQ